LPVESWDNIKPDRQKVTITAVHQKIENTLFRRSFSTLGFQLLQDIDLPGFTFSSKLPVPAEQVLATLNMVGVNAELYPLVKMTAPNCFAECSILGWPQRQQLFKSWVLLFGIVPIDHHSFYFDTINPEEGFSESSSSTTNAIWSHERKITPQPTGCCVIDTVRYKSRLPFIDVILKPAYKLVFWRRHQNLRSKYGGCAA
jgi:hypothetical protein